MLKQQIEKDLKTALLARDKDRAEVLRGLKSAILYEEVAKNARETGLSEESVLGVIAREAKRREESARMYEQAGETERAKTERSEKQVIEVYLPAQMSDEELAEAIDAAIAEAGEGAQMGQIIGAVKKIVGPKADGSRIAAAVKAKL